MSDLAQLKAKIEKIEARNDQVEINKAWEQSWTRKGLLILLTYLCTAFVFHQLKVEQPWFNACIPTLGYLLSTLSLGWVKKLWVKLTYNGNQQ
jgi:hypothetical protein